MVQKKSNGEFYFILWIHIYFSRFVASQIVKYVWVKFQVNYFSYHFWISSIQFNQNTSCYSPLLVIRIDSLFPRSDKLACLLLTTSISGLLSQFRKTGLFLLAKDLGTCVPSSVEDLLGRCAFVSGKLAIWWLYSFSIQRD